eukprot:61472-Rhodomonas_salina.2
MIIDCAQRMRVSAQRERTEGGCWDWEEEVEKEGRREWVVCERRQRERAGKERKRKRKRAREREYERKKKRKRKEERGKRKEERGKRKSGILTSSISHEALSSGPVTQNCSIFSN